jgi:hypothetical protein
VGGIGRWDDLFLCYLPIAIYPRGGLSAWRDAVSRGNMSKVFGLCGFASRVSGFPLVDAACMAGRFRRFMRGYQFSDEALGLGGFWSGSSLSCMALE